MSMQYNLNIFAMPFNTWRDYLNIHEEISGMFKSVIEIRLSLTDAVVPF